MIGNFEIKRRDLNLLPGITNTSDLSSICSLFLCLPVFQFNSLSDFASKSVWLNSVAYQYIFPVHNLVESTKNGEEIELRESKSNFRIKTREGKYRFNLSLICDIDYFIRLKSYEGQDLKCYLGDINGNLIGKRVVNSILPFSIDALNISRIELGANLPPVTNIYMDLSDPLEIQSGYHIKPTFDFDSIQNVTVSIESITEIDSNSISFTVIDPCSNPITGLLSTDFTIFDNINGNVTFETFTEIGNGEYRIDANETLYFGDLRLISSVYNATESYSLAVIPQYNPLQYNNTQYKVS